MTMRETIVDTAFSNEIGKVMVDSREIRGGELFFAIPGRVTDGHHFLQEVKDKGVRGAVIRNDYTGFIPEGLHVIRVDDPLKALQDLAKAVVKKLNAKIIAVTGSVGKTTTKEFIRTILSQNHSVAATTGNYNTEISLPMSLINEIHGDEKWVVAEMGMTKPGHIRFLTDIAPPDIALVTTVAHVHAMNFHSLEDIARAKAEIFECAKTEWNVFNEDIGYSHIFRHIGSGRKRSFSRTQKAFWTLEEAENQLIVRECGEAYYLPKPVFPAKHVYDNLLAAISACRAGEVGWDEIQGAMEKLRLPERRLEKVQRKGVVFINDSYNACELSMLSALDVLSSQKSARRIAVLGQMGELGKFSVGCHQRVAMRALDAADELYCLGVDCEPMVEEWKKVNRQCFWTTSLSELVEKLQKDVQKGDVVLLKGSKSNKLWKVIDNFVEEKV